MDATNTPRVRQCHFVSRFLIVMAAMFQGPNIEAVTVDSCSSLMHAKWPIHQPGLASYPESGYST